MSKTKSLSLAQEAEMKTMVVEGTQPQKIADHFKIGISTVHNYKKMFREQGLDFPSVRGRQTQQTGTTTPRAAVTPQHPSTNRQIQNQAASSQTQASSGVQGNVFVVNGTSINISGQAQSVNINKSVTGEIVFEIKM